MYNVSLRAIESSECFGDSEGARLGNVCFLKLSSFVHVLIFDEIMRIFIFRNLFFFEKEKTHFSSLCSTACPSTDAAEVGTKAHLARLQEILDRVPTPPALFFRLDGANFRGISRESPECRSSLYFEDISRAFQQILRSTTHRRRVGR